MAGVALQSDWDFHVVSVYIEEVDVSSPTPDARRLFR